MRPSAMAATASPPGEERTSGSLRLPNPFNARFKSAGLLELIVPSAEIHSGQVGSQPGSLERTTRNRVCRTPPTGVGSALAAATGLDIERQLPAAGTALQALAAVSRSTGSRLVTSFASRRST